MIGVIVPAHNEEAYLGACLRSLQEALRCPALNDEEAEIIVVLDACRDRTAEIARQFNVTSVVCDFRNVGAARAFGASAALSRGARWLAFTDADSEVAPDWLSTQLALDADAVCGTVSVRDWSEHPQAIQAHFLQTYRDIDGHSHIHGANLGVSAQAYQRAGGFKPLATSEDVALVQDLKARGAVISWSCKPRVFTSARKAFRAPGGFGATLNAISTRQCSLGAA